MALKRYLIERKSPGVGDSSRKEFREAAQRSNKVLAEMAPDIQWVESFVASDRTFCVYLARDEAVIREHAERAGFPATRIAEIRRVIDPTTAGR